MNKLLFLLFTPVLALADPSAKSVQVNIHNNTAHTIELKSFDSSRAFASTTFSKENIAPMSSVNSAIYFTSFDMNTITAGVNIVIDGEPMKLMWQTNMGFDDPDAEKFHICGVIKDNNPQINHEYCYIPYVDDSVLYVDFNIE